MQATEFEFRYRLWIIAAIFVVAFLLYRVDHRVAAVVCFSNPTIAAAWTARAKR